MTAAPVTMTAGAVTMTTSAHRWPACCGETSCGLRDGRARPRDEIRADRSDGRSLPRCGSRRPERPEAAPGMWPAPSSAFACVHGRVARHQLAVGPGTRLHAWTSDGALRDRTRAWTHGQGAC